MSKQRENKNIRSTYNMRVNTGLNKKGIGSDRMLLPPLYTVHGARVSLAELGCESLSRLSSSLCTGTYSDLWVGLGWIDEKNKEIREIYMYRLFVLSWIDEKQRKS